MVLGVLLLAMGPLAAWAASAGSLPRVDRNILRLPSPGQFDRLPDTRLELDAALPLDAPEFHAAKGIPEAFFGQKLSALERRLFDDAADGCFDDHTLLEAALVASGAESREQLRRYTERQAALVQQLRQRVRPDDSPRYQAETVFEFMHSQVLRGGYRIDCTDLRAALDCGQFNCVSASVLFNCLADAVGLPVCGLEIPGHAMSRVRLPDSPLDIETTCAEWFRLMHDPGKQAAAVTQTIGSAPNRRRGPAREVTPVQVVAMIYYNRGVDSLAEKQFAAAAAANSKALWLDPDSATAKGNLLATINNWAIDLGNRGQFAEARNLLQQGMSLDPGYETFATNYVHVHHQWVQRLCQDAQFETALAVLGEAAARQPSQPYFGQAALAVYQQWIARLRADGKLGEADRVARQGMNDPRPGKAAGPQRAPDAVGIANDRIGSAP